jgi:hypothetical protein
MALKYNKKVNNNEPTRTKRYFSITRKPIETDPRNLTPKINLKNKFAEEPLL